MPNPFVEEFLKSGGRTPEEYAQRVDKFLAGMPCCNRETAAEKAAAREWMRKQRTPARIRRARQVLAKLRAS